MGTAEPLEIIENLNRESLSMGQDREIMRVGRVNIDNGILFIAHKFENPHICVKDTTDMILVLENLQGRALRCYGGGT